MTQILLDTHAWVWSFNAQKRLSQTALAALSAATHVAISSVSFYEIGQKVRLGKWPEMESRVAALATMARQQGVEVLDVTAEISLSAGILRWPHRDPFDRIISATAMTAGRSLISADLEFDALFSHSGWPGRVW